MTTTQTPVTRWCKSKCEGTSCDGGSQYNAQKRLFAVRVAAVLAGEGDEFGTVCHCGAPISLWVGEVDRTVSGCYAPGSVVMTCEACNNDRTHVAGFDVAAFTLAVLVASANVAIPGVTAATSLYKSGRDTGRTVRNSRFFRG